ncbi:MAG TPA: glycosyltransferase [Opitutaceae bacterium]
MNILFANYGDFTTNSLNHIGGFANALSAAGHSCIVAVPFRKESLDPHSRALYHPALFSELLERPRHFLDGRGADLIHAWTPREWVRAFVSAYQSLSPARLVVHLEDNEQYLLESYTRKSLLELESMEPGDAEGVLTGALCHPLRRSNLLRLADAVTVIEERLAELVPGGAETHLLWPGLDPIFSKPQPLSPDDRRQLGIRDDERLLVFTGSTSFANEAETRALYLAVALFNQEGVHTRLVCTGFTSPQFRASIPGHVAAHVLDLGLIEKDRLPALLASADVLVQPGRAGPFNDYRLPSKIPEFLASRRPVIVPATNIGRHLREGVDALLLHDGTPEEIAQTCRLVFENPALAESLGRNGRQFACSHFDLQKNAARLAALYARVLAAPARTNWKIRSGGAQGDLALILEQSIGGLRDDRELARSIVAQVRELAHDSAGLDQLTAKSGKLSEELELARQHAGNLEHLLEHARSDLENARKHSANLEATLEELQRRTTDLEVLAARADERLRFAQEQAASLQTALHAREGTIRLREDKIRRMQESFSWKVTSPIRALRRLLSGKPRAPAGGPGPVPHPPAAPTASWTSPEVEFMIDEPRTWTGLPVTNLAIRGWLARPDGAPVTALRARCGDSVFAARMRIPRADVQAAYPDHPHAAESGFAIDLVIPQPGADVILEHRTETSAWEPFFRTSATLAPDATETTGDAYQAWIRANEDHSAAALGRQRDEAAGWANAPRISILMPVFNTPERWLRHAVESVIGQTYSHWELCIADDASTAPHVRAVLDEIARRDPRIKVSLRETNGHISAASNSALDLATGDWIGLLDHDDELAPDALFEVARIMLQEPDTDLVYSDEDKIDESGARSTPYFKPEFLPDLFTAQNFVSHLGVYRTALVREAGGFRVGYEGSQDWDLALRVVEHTQPERIRHIPRILYHWRAIPGSTALLLSEKNYPVEAARKALQDHLARTDQHGAVVAVPGGHWRIKHEPPEPAPLVSLIIPTRNCLHLLERCVDSIMEKTTYPRYEILIVDNGSDDPATLDWLRSVARDHPGSNLHSVRVLRDGRPFNYSALNNGAVAQARGEYVALINNDLEVITPEWLDEMVGQAARPGVGCVGAMLYFPDDTIQHAGVVLGIGGVAGHAFKRFPRGTEGVFNRARLVQNYSAVTAACLVVRKSIYEQVGGLGEKALAVAFNDVDFCLKVRAAGYRNLWTPSAELYHHESASRGFEDTPEKHDRFRREIETMQQRWGGLLLADPAYNPNLTLDHEDFSISIDRREKPLVRQRKTDAIGDEISD